MFTRNKVFGCEIHCYCGHDSCPGVVPLPALGPEHEAIEAACAAVARARIVGRISARAVIHTTVGEISGFQLGSYAHTANAAAPEAACISRVVHDRLYALEFTMGDSVACLYAAPLED